ncbi:MAG: amidohydrolase [Pirellula sp.]|nr:amidohydrolase [Pirellula sp.]
MRLRISSLLSLALLAILGLGRHALAADEQPASRAKQAARAGVVARADQIGSLGKQVWEFAEPAFQEHRSSALLAETLEKEGFTVRRGVAEMPTAFVAEFGSGKPVVGLLAEYDALPGLSQAAEPVMRPLPRQVAGHGCGHNLFGAAIVGAAVSAKEAMQKHKLAGTLRVYGCPAEEGGCGKAYLIRAGEMKDVDVALHWHPGTSNQASMRTSLAIIRFRARFTGVSAHAAGSPHLGRSALDGIELMNTGINFLREHVPSTARIHYVITNGGKRPNVVPQEAEAWYYIRAPKMAEAQAIYARVRKIAEGASLMTETKHELRMVTGSYEVLVNEPLAKAMDANLRAVGPPQFSAEELAFAAAIRKEFGVASPPEERPIVGDVEKFGTDATQGSTDVGDVSWTVPTAGLGIATAAREIPAHSWAMTACAGSPLGTRGSVVAAEVLAATTIDVFEQPELIAAARKDFAARTKSTTYETVLSPGPAPERLDDF